MNRFEEKVKKLLPAYELEQYREGKDFVEFWMIDTDRPANTSIEFLSLVKLSRLLGTTDISVTGGNFKAPYDSGPDEFSYTNVLVTAYGVKFPRRRKS